MNDPQAKRARPEPGRASLANDIQAIGRKANDLHYQARWLTSRLDLEKRPDFDRLYCQALEALDEASQKILEVAIAISLGAVDFLPTKLPEPRFPLFEQPEPLQLAHQSESEEDSGLGTQDSGETVLSPDPGSSPEEQEPIRTTELEIEIPLDDEERPERARPFATDELLHMACHSSTGMAERWEQLAREGATELEVRATLSRAFDCGLCDVGGKKMRGGFLVLVDGRGECSFLPGNSPKFWTNRQWDGKPTLEGRQLVRTVRIMYQIPEEAGGKPPVKKEPRPKAGV
jgi:hypothetical protein